MKIEELIREHDLAFNAEAALKSVDWNFDVNGVEGSRFNQGQKAMKDAQQKIKELYRQSPQAAEKLWLEHCPYARPNVMPSWILK